MKHHLFFVVYHQNPSLNIHPILASVDTQAPEPEPAKEEKALVAKGSGKGSIRSGKGSIRVLAGLCRGCI